MTPDFLPANPTQHELRNLEKPQSALMEALVNKPKIQLRWLHAGLTAGTALLLAMPAIPALAQGKTLRIAMTAADIPKGVGGERSD